MKNINIIPTKKYKHLTVEWRFTKPYDLKEYAALFLLDGFIGKYSQAYPDKRSMTRIKDLLYDLHVNSGVTARGGLMIYKLAFQCVNPAYLNDVTFKDYEAFIIECLDHPFFTEERLKEIQKNLLSDTERYLEKPRNKAQEDLIDKIAQDRPAFKQYARDIRESLKTITLDDVQKVYAQLFETYQNDIWVLGDASEEFQAFLNGRPTTDLRFFQKEAAYENQAFKGDIILNEVSDQSYLSLVFTSPYDRSHIDYFAHVMTVMLFGGSPLSLLFAKVREAEHLCYTIDAINYPCEGLIKVTTGIDATRFEKAKTAILQELEALQKGAFPEELLIASQKLMANTLIGLYDSYDEYLNYLFINTLSGSPLTLEEHLEKILAVTKDDIVRIAKHYHLDIIHFLKGEQDA